MEKMTETYYLSMILIGVGSFVFGILPIAFSFRVTRSYPLFLSLILCLGGGVLLATSVVHMLTEVQEKLKFYAQLYFCAGFLTLYSFDEISDYCLGNNKSEAHSTIPEYERISNERGHYGAGHSSCENSPLLQTSQYRNIKSLIEKEQFEGRDSPKLHSARSSMNDKKQPQQNLLDAYFNSENEDSDRVTYHLDVQEHWSSNSAAKTGLLIALLIHSILEGISIGVQTKISQVLLILGAVMFHKFVLSFCLGLELHNNGFKTLHLLAAVFIFSIGSPFGIFLGMMVTSFENGIFGIDAELQAVAAGSLLYVAAFEVLPRERFKWQHKNYSKGAGIFQLIFVIIGFMCITVFHMYVGFPNDGGSKIVNITKKFS